MRRNLLEQFEPLAAQRVLDSGEAGDIAGRPRQTCYEATADRIGDVRKDDGDGASFLQQHRRSWCGMRKNEVRMQRDEFFRESLPFFRVVGWCPARIDRDFLTLYPPELLEFLPESRDVCLCFRVALRIAHQCSDPPHPVSLLRARRERPCRGASAEQGDELAPLHSITSSARASSVDGTSSPNALAVLRLMTNSYLVGSMTGRSAGLASPLRIRAT